MERRREAVAKGVSKTAIRIHFITQTQYLVNEYWNCNERYFLEKNGDTALMRLI